MYCRDVSSVTEASSVVCRALVIVGPSTGEKKSAVRQTSAFTGLEREGEHVSCGFVSPKLLYLYRKPSHHPLLQCVFPSHLAADACVFVKPVELLKVCVAVNRCRTS